jgi:hypothetical protein
MSIGCVGGNSISAGSMTASSEFGDSRRLMIMLLAGKTIVLKRQGATRGFGHEAHRSTSNRSKPVPNVLFLEEPPGTKDSDDRR